MHDADTAAYAVGNCHGADADADGNHCDTHSDADHGKSDADAYAYCDTHADADAYAYCDTHSDADHGKSDTHPDADHGKSDPNPNTHPDTHPDSNHRQPRQPGKGPLGRRPCVLGEVPRRGEAQQPQPVPDQRLLRQT
ncbi:hypothetical protein [Paenarthrobacter nitroguajacolicus]|uniref:hypothetical protein n=1 Tax=Paenarthrobacter nitroguajacolicus TaxID=211146 RepID=UPI00142ED66A|nr:hypothetical protein [Paenarthrobacter nitroguajacolicus]